MDEDSSAPLEFFSVLDNFGSEVGTTLNDLATDWEDDTEKKSNENRSDKISASNEDLSDDIGRKMAKPLTFYNPVYKMFHKNSVFQKIKRPTLIPLSQLNGSGKETEISLKPKKKTKAQKGKKSGKFGNIFGALASRRVSNTPLAQDDSNHHNQEKRQSVESHNSSEFSTSSNLPSPHKSSSSSSPTKALTEPKKTDKVPPIKSPRMSRTLVADDVKHIVRKESSSSNDKPDLTQSGDDLSGKNDEKGNDTIVLSETKNEVPLSSPTENKRSNRATEIGSTSSLSSISEGRSQTDSEVKTMEDVISEMAKRDPNEVGTHDPISTEPISPEPNKGKLFKRDRTLRWTGNRKAPKLMREFTRKNLSIEATMEVAGSTEELDAINKKTADKSDHLLEPALDSRSCTPSQLTTSFDMTDDHYAIDETAYDDYIPDNQSVFAEDKAEVQNKTSKTEGARSPSNRDSTFIVLSSLLPPAPRLRRSQSSKIRSYLHKLGSSQNNPLGYAVTQFVEETLKNKETRPIVLLHDVRSFLSDIKHYLITNPAINLRKKIEKIVTKPNVDIDGAVDDSLDRLILYPLHDTIYRCLVISYKESGHLEVMREAMSLAKKKTTKELGIRKTLVPPDAEAMEVIKGHFTQLQRTYSPYFKLRELLGAVTKIYQSTKDLTADDQSARKLGADDFLPLLVYAVVQCDFLAADIETQYMDGLLDPNLLLGEGGYYLTTLISAIQVVISIQRKEAALPNISDLQGFLKVGIASAESHPFKKGDPSSSEDELILHKTLHVPPAMTAHNLCHMISKKFNVEAPEDYCLHVVVNDVAYALESNDCPQLVKMDLLTQYPSTSFFFSFQRRSSSTFQNDLTCVGSATAEASSPIDRDGKVKEEEEKVEATNPKKDEVNESGVCQEEGSKDNDLPSSQDIDNNQEQVDHSNETIAINEAAIETETNIELKNSMSVPLTNPHSLKELSNSNQLAVDNDEDNNTNIEAESSNKVGNNPSMIIGLSESEIASSTMNLDANSVDDISSTVVNVPDTGTTDNSLNSGDDASSVDETLSDTANDDLTTDETLLNTVECDATVSLINANDISSTVDIVADKTDSATADNIGVVADNADVIADNVGETIESTADVDTAISVREISDDPTKEAANIVAEKADLVTNTADDQSNTADKVLDKDVNNDDIVPETVDIGLNTPKDCSNDPDIVSDQDDKITSNVDSVGNEVGVVPDNADASLLAQNVDTVSDVVDVASEPADISVNDTEDNQRTVDDISNSSDNLTNEATDSIACSANELSLENTSKLSSTDNIVERNSDEPEHHNNCESVPECVDGVVDTAANTDTGSTGNNQIIASDLDLERVSNASESTETASDIDVESVDYTFNDEAEKTDLEEKSEAKPHDEDQDVCVASPETLDHSTIENDLQDSGGDSNIELTADETKTPPDFNLNKDECRKSETTEDETVLKSISFEELANDNAPMQPDKNEDVKLPELDQNKDEAKDITIPCNVQITIEEATEKLENLPPVQESEEFSSPEKVCKNSVEVFNDDKEKKPRRSSSDSPSHLTPLNSQSPVTLRPRRTGSVPNDSTYSSYNTSPFKRISCMPRESVATLKEFFEGKSAESSPEHQKSK